jgi:predicted NAD/FAD-dependent oxidoreductase
MSSVAVIGAGISGCVAARELLKANYKVFLIEKSASMGGRLATRRVGLPNNELYLKADTGAQFITARSQDFKDQFIRPGIEGKYLHVWSVGGFSDTNLGNSSITADKHPRYSSTFGLNGAIKRAFSDLLVHPNCTVHFNTKVDSILCNGQMIFQLKLDNQDVIECNHVFITLPLPQAVPLVKNVVLQQDQLSSFKCNVQNISVLADIKYYDPCLCLIIIMPAILAKSLISSDKGARRITTDPVIQWIASSNSKGMNTPESKELDAITIHCNSAFSRENYDLSDSSISEKILSTPLLQQYREAIQSQSVKKWKYAVPIFPTGHGEEESSLEDSVSNAFLKSRSMFHFMLQNHLHLCT